MSVLATRSANVSPQLSPTTFRRQLKEQQKSVEELRADLLRMRERQIAPPTPPTPPSPPAGDDFSLEDTHDLTADMIEDEVYEEVILLQQTASLAHESASFYLRLGSLRKSTNYGQLATLNTLEISSTKIMKSAIRIFLV